MSKPIDRDLGNLRAELKNSTGGPKVEAILAAEVEKIAPHWYDLLVREGLIVKKSTE